MAVLGRPDRPPGSGPHSRDDNEDGGEDCANDHQGDDAGRDAILLRFATVLEFLAAATGAARVTTRARHAEFYSECVGHPPLSL